MRKRRSRIRIEEREREREREGDIRGETDRYRGGGKRHRRVRRGRKERQTGRGTGKCVLEYDYISSFLK